MSELPDSWVLVQLGVLGAWGSGGTPKRTNNRYYAAEGIPWLVIGDLNDRVVVKSSNFITELGLQNSSAKLLPVGTLLVAMYGSIGKLGINGIECATNQAIAFCQPNDAIVGLRYLYHALFNAKPKLLALGQGGAQQNISQSVLKEFQVALAPKNEQTRIANQLDTLLTRVQACNDRFDAIPALLKRFRQTVLDAAVSGSLSEDWRLSRGQAQASTGPRHVTKDLPEGWSWSCAEEIKATDRHALAIGPFGSSLKVSDYTEEGVPLVFVREIRSRRFSGGNTKFISLQKARELKAHSIQGGDLLITKMGDPPGDVAIYPSDAPLAVITADCVRLRVDDTVALAAFVGYTIVCTDTRTRLRDITAGVAQRKISLSRFRHFPLPLAPLSEQAEIVRRVETLFAMVDLIEARCTSARTQAQRLTPLVLAKAFRGELVTQDPNDEPASELLASIASSDTPVAGKNKRKVPVALKERAKKAIKL